MPYGDSPAGDAGSGSSIMRIDWKSALFGGAVMVAASYLGVMRPADRQITALEAQVSRLAASVESLDGSRDGLGRATSLLGRIEAQAARLAAAEAAVARFEVLGSRLVNQAPALAAVDTALDRAESLHARIAQGSAVIDDVAVTVGEMEELTGRVAAARETTRAAVVAVDAVRGDLEAGTSRLVAAETAVDRLIGLARSLADRQDDTAAAAARLDQLAGLQHRLLRTTADLEAADAAITRLADINLALGDASGTLGRLQRFVVDIVLLEPTFNRAVRALEPVVEFTAAGRRLEVKGAGSDAAAETKAGVVRDVARSTGDETR